MGGEEVILHEIGDSWVALRLKRESRARPSRPGSRQPSIADA